MADRVMQVILYTQCLKITPKVAFHIEKFKLAVKQCYHTRQFHIGKNCSKIPKFKKSNGTF